LQLQTNAAIQRIGLGAQEAEQQQRINDIYAEQAVALAELNKELRRNPDFQAEYDADVAALQEATDEQVRIVTDGFQRMLAAQADWHNGFKQGLADWLAGTANVAEQIAGITNRALDSASDALANFALTGKLEIKELLVSILSDIVKFLAQRAIMQFIMAFLPGAMTPTNFGIPMPGSGPAVGFNAAGNPYPGGTSLPSNTVLTKPTLFKFANGGSFGVAGEAGAEAIMPLKRGADGKLGVRLHGGGSMVNLKVETNVYSDGRSDTRTTTEGDRAALYGEFSDHMQRVAKREVEEQMRPGGSLWRAGVRAG
jgi:lambda family phage tail tape measure protein